MPLVNRDTYFSFILEKEILQLEIVAFLVCPISVTSRVKSLGGGGGGGGSLYLLKQARLGTRFRYGGAIDVNKFEARRGN